VLGLAALVLAGWGSTASARILHFQVTVSVSGPGRVTGTGDGGSIDCPGTCSAMIRQETFITLTAMPNGGAQFTSWGGSCTEAGTASMCTLVISGPKEVTAGFGTPPPPITRFNLTVKKAGTGTGFVGGAGGIDCGPTCSAAFQEGTKVNLLAVADDGAEFKGWTGAGCSGTGQCAVTVTADTEVTATFDHLDREPPRIRTIGGVAKRGGTARLRFRVFDNSGESREVLTIMNGRSTIGRVAVPLAEVVYRQIYTASWRVPRGTAKGRHRYCGVAADKAGNRSKRSCSTLRLT
jgi:Divergent InlB B-repeat domain